MIQIDGNPLDMCTVVVGLLVGAARPIRRAWWRQSIAIDPYSMIYLPFCGMLIVPFFCLFASVFSNALLLELSHSNNTVISMGGIAGLFVAIRETCKDEPPKH